MENESKANVSEKKKEKTPYSFFLKKLIGFIDNYKNAVKQ